MLLKRIGYYLIGLSIGTIGVYFFWQKKNASFDYGMDARTLKSIRIKERIYSKASLSALAKYSLDTSDISKILLKGDVNFGKSKPREKPCAEYYITGKDSLESFSFYIKRCDSIAIVKNIWKK